MVRRHMVSSNKCNSNSYGSIIKPIVKNLYNFHILHVYKIIIKSCNA
jgi:hypothetical protein